MASRRCCPVPLYELLEIAYNIKAWLRLKKAVRAFKPDVIYERFSLLLFAGIWVKRAFWPAAAARSQCAAI